MKTQIKVLVTGAAGKSAGAAIEELLKNGVSVKALVHKADERAKKLVSKGVEVIVGDFLNFDDIANAMQGVDSAYFCFPVLVPGLLQATAYFAQAAKDAGVKTIVNMSQISARRDSKSNAAQDHWVGERILDMTGIPVTHLRPTFFDDWFLYIREEIQQENLITLPFGDGRWAPIDSADLGLAVAKLLVDPKDYRGKTIRLFGPEEYNVYEMSEILSSVLNRKITYKPVSMEEFTSITDKKGAHPHFIQHVTHVAQDCVEGLFSGTSDDLERITGAKPTTLAEFFTEKKMAF
ncbi:NmrA family NAD(P)-binding protein [Mucilaginibacter sp. cycad4]|uniref:NmrA family NAD(P)-binding protein n=1 Tax=Mucilaginibacter sp. cycad4 TaxID=3342096 RepID=UPI002AAAB4B1|nr:NmrA family NAD(P)-binding protein [Mucilaginibacter gossypii]WPU99180.1 NmrA family NAD(P)-binding protein [Mucilaginibacter gossypii]